MAPQTLAARMDSLEERVSRLEELPARVDASDVAGFATARRDAREFSAIPTARRCTAWTNATSRERDSSWLRGHRTAMRVLYEDLVAKLAIAGEGAPPQRKR